MVVQWPRELWTSQICLYSPWVNEPLCYSCLPAFPLGITSQEAVNLQSRLISFPRSPVQRRASCANKSATYYLKCDLSAVYECRWVAARHLLIFVQELTRLRRRLHLAKKYSLLIHSLEKLQGLDLLEHLSSGGFNRSVRTLLLKVHSSFESSPKTPAKPTNSACRLKTRLISSNPWQPSMFVLSKRIRLIPVCSFANILAQLLNFNTKLSHNPPVISDWFLCSYRYLRLYHLAVKCLTTSTTVC